MNDVMSSAKLAIKLSLSAVVEASVVDDTTVVVGVATVVVDDVPVVIGGVVSSGIAADKITAS